MSGSEMSRFWDERAQEDALYFIDTRRTFRDGDLDSFWASGEEDLAKMLGSLGATLDADDVALDIGCGAGRLTRAIARRARRAYGIDVSGEMIARARELNAELANVEWYEGDGTSLRPLGDGSVDAVVSIVVFQHIPDPEITYGYVREIGRVLRPGGWAAIHVSNDPSVHRPPGRPGLRERAGELLGRRPRGREHRAWLGSAVELPVMGEVAAGAGLSFERVIGEGTQYCGILARRG